MHVREEMWLVCAGSCVGLRKHGHLRCSFVRDCGSLATREVCRGDVGDIGGG